MLAAVICGYIVAVSQAVLAIDGAATHAPPCAPCLYLVCGCLHQASPSVVLAEAAEQADLFYLCRGHARMSLVAAWLEGLR